MKKIFIDGKSGTTGLRIYDRLEAVSFIKNPDTVILDTSTAHRTQPGWAYGFPELGPEFAQAVKTGKRIAVP